MSVLTCLVVAGPAPNYHLRADSVRATPESVDLLSCVYFCPTTQVVVSVLLHQGGWPGATARCIPRTFALCHAVFISCDSYMNFRSYLPSTYLFLS